MFRWLFGKPKQGYEVVDDQLFGEFLKWKIHNEAPHKQTVWEKMVELRIKYGA